MSKASKELVPALNKVPEYFTPRQIELITRQICPGATADELQMFLADCQRTRLDPFARQIYSIERTEKYRDANGNWKTRKKRVTQYSIDGFRLIAERTGDYAGQLGPEWCGIDGKWRDIWTDDVPPAAARVAALRKDFKEPLWTPALFSEYAPRYDGKLTGRWAQAPAGMLAKCAEALALRRAFPNELSNAYTGDEMMAAQAHDVTPAPAIYADKAEYDAGLSADLDRAQFEPVLHGEPSSGLLDEPASAAAPSTSPAADALTPPVLEFLKKVVAKLKRALTPAEQDVAVMAYEAATRGHTVLMPFFNKRNAADKKFLRSFEELLVALYPPLTAGK